MHDELHPQTRLENDNLTIQVYNDIKTRVVHRPS